MDTVSPASGKKTQTQACASLGDDSDDDDAEDASSDDGGGDSNSDVAPVLQHREPSPVVVATVEVAAAQVLSGVKKRKRLVARQAAGQSCGLGKRKVEVAP